MTEAIAAEVINGQDPSILLLCDHASNQVPAGFELGIAPELLDLHIGYDIGAADVTRGLAASLGVPAILGSASRLVIDLHRSPDHPGLIPTTSDGYAIPGNLEADRQARISRIYAPYHRTIAKAVRDLRPRLLMAVHSFTPQLENGGGQRPWRAGVLYNRDRRAADVLIDLLRGEGIETGDNQPYSGRDLNTTLNRHGEANGIASVSLEIRNNEIDHAPGVAHWVTRLSKILPELRNRVASKGPVAT